MQKAVNTVVLNAHRLVFDSDSFMLMSTDGTNQTIVILGYKKNYDAGILEVRLNETLPVNTTWMLKADYNGPIFQQPRGGAYMNYHGYEFDGKTRYPSVFCECLDIPVKRDFRDGF